MSTKTEDIRLSINNVKHKKGDGTLYLMAERLAWMPNAKNNFTISHKYSDIKMQKISPEGKAKIQLQIVLHTGDNTTFQFNNIEDRTAVKDALLLIIPQFKGKIPKDREKKALLLSKNPSLLQLYKDLVETKLISADDFWTQFVDERAINDTYVQTEAQDVGVSADFLAGIPLNGKQIKGTVNVETLWAILKTYPKVARKHQELVPTKMTETEFWNKFFQSRYFNRDRSKDLFTDCAKSDEKEWSANLKKGISDPFLDLDMFSDHAYQTTQDDPPPNSSHENPDQLLIKRFNQQSIRLIESLKHKEDDQDQELAVDPTDSQSTTTTTNQPSFRANARDTKFKDLAGQDTDGNCLVSSDDPKMHAIERELYSIVAQPSQSGLSQAAINDHAEALKAWEPQLTDCIAPKDATEALKNLSPRGYLMRSTNTHRLTDTIPEEVQDRLKMIYKASNEILRHFWMCFPATDQSLENKLTKLNETLEKFQSSKLQPFYESLPRDQRHLLNHIMRGQFKTAARKYENWRGKGRQITR